MKSKTGEIERRILQSEKIVDSIAEKDESSELPASLEASRSNQKARQSLVLRLRQEVVQLTRDVQRLSRFIGVQRTGFRKLLKKYKKWSHSSSLSERFLPVLEAPSSFTNQDFTPIFLELSLLYNVLRQAKITSINASTPQTFQSSNQTIITFDCEMVTSLSSSAVFWIHPDNLVETKVTLLKNLSLVSDSSLPANASYTNLAALTEAAQHASDTPVDLTFTTFLDDKKKFYSIQTNSEPGQIKTVLQSSQPNKTLTPVLCSPVGGLRHFCIANLSEEQQNLILHSQYEALSSTLKGMDNISKLALGWVQKRHVSPIAKVSSQRTRFRYSEKFTETMTTTGSEASSPNTYMDSPDIWATMDNNVKFSKLAATLPEWNEEFEDTTEFPYCVLEIRWKGMNKPAWVSDLEQSHLVYPVKGFSTYAFSVAHYYPDALSVIPKWMEAVNNNVDIRRAPSSRNTIRRGHSKSSLSLSSQTVTAPVSPGILLNNETQPLLRPPSRPPYKSRVSSYGTSDKLGSEGQRPDQPVVRYWNEFDDPEDGQDDGVFVVIPEEDFEDGIFNDDNVFYLMSLGESILNKAISIKQKFVGFFQGHKSPTQKRGLTTIHEEDEDSLDDDEEEEDTEFEGYYSPRFKSRYHSGGVDDEESTDYFSVQRHSAALEQRNSVLSALYSICFFLSVLIVCILFGVLLGEDMNAITMGTYIFIIAGFFVALAISVLAMGLFLMRSDMPVWWHQTIVFATFFSIICFGVGGIAWAFL